MQCIVKGCTNCKQKGQFVGDICMPCYEMITTGKIGKGETFIHDIQDNKLKMQAIIDNLLTAIEEYVLYGKVD